GIELDDVDAGNHRIEDVGSTGDHVERLRDAGLSATVLVFVSVGSRDNNWLATLGRHHRRCLRLAEERLRRGCRGDTGGGRGSDELPAIQLLSHDGLASRNSSGAAAGW